MSSITYHTVDKFNMNSLRHDKHVETFCLRHDKRAETVYLRHEMRVKTVQNSYVSNMLEIDAYKRMMRKASKGRLCTMRISSTRLCVNAQTDRGLRCPHM